MASKFKTDKVTGHDKANLEMIKKLAKDMYPVSEKDVKKLIKASQ